MYCDSDAGRWGCCGAGRLYWTGATVMESWLGRIIRKSRKAENNKTKRLKDLIYLG